MASKKHAEVIRAWLDGKAIQIYNDYSNEWIDAHEPSFIAGSKYRIKPAEIRIKGFTLTIEQATVLYGLLNSCAASTALAEMKESDDRLRACFPGALADSFRSLEAYTLQGELYSLIGRNIKLQLDAALTEVVTLDRPIGDYLK